MIIQDDYDHHFDCMLQLKQDSYTNVKIRVVSALQGLQHSFIITRLKLTLLL